MISNRRSFLRTGSLVIGASLLRPRTLLSFGEKTPGTLSFDAAEMRLLDFAASYGTSVRLTGISVLSRLRGGRAGVHLLVEVNDFVTLATALLIPPCNNIFANDNRLSLVSSGSVSVIENLSVEDFAARLAQLSQAENIVFAHDALMFDPATKAFADPFGALDPELKLVTRPATTIASVEAALRGTGEARAAGLVEGKDFAQWKAQLFTSTVHWSAAQPIAAAFMKKLPAFAALAGTEDVKRALKTPLISSAVSSALGLNSRTVIAEFDRVRAIFGQAYSDGAVWLYVLLGQQMRTDTRGWISTDLFEDAHWREAFTNARRIEQAFQTPELKSQAG